ncbi:MAG TPA: hypothetical protein VFL29_13045 [Candidatus Dormibacteraeota bacterium]|nr:hypothetical protein [Candidatus Dormibacteraeota bacterium]
MTPAAYQPFFTASVAASAALIGLLFVSISIAPERIFGKEAVSSRQAQALSAFTALANIFFISFGGLMPDVPLGIMVTIVSIPALIQTLELLGRIGRWRTERALYRGVFLFLASAVVYSFELWIGIQMWRDPTSQGWLSGLLDLLLGAYAIGLGRAWELMGAPRGGILFGLLDKLFGTLDRTRKKDGQATR